MKKTQISFIVNEAIMRNDFSLEQVDNLSSLEKARLSKSLLAIKTIVDGKYIQDCSTCSNYKYITGYGNSDRGLDKCNCQECSENTNIRFKGDVVNCSFYTKRRFFFNLIYYDNKRIN